MILGGGGTLNPKYRRKTK